MAKKTVQMQLLKRGGNNFPVVLEFHCKGLVILLDLTITALNVLQGKPSVNNSEHVHGHSLASPLVHLNVQH